MIGAISRCVRRFRRPVFVVGTGRSGTHWLGRILASHAAFRVTIESEPHFGWATRMATHPKLQERLLDRHVWAYLKQRIRSVPLRYGDKSHPNIWIADRLADRIRGAVFLGVNRNPYAVVASMLQHDGVLSWIERWEELPLPSPFLGVEAGEEDRYRSLPLAAKCALRWKSHQERMVDLVQQLGPRLHVVSYEDLILRTERELTSLQHALGLEQSFSQPRVKEDSLDRWHHELDDRQLRAVGEIVGFGPDELDRMRIPRRHRPLALDS